MIKLTKEQIDLVAPELAERVKDVTYALAEQRMRNVLEKFTYLQGDESSKPVVVTYEINMCLGDILQVLAREARRRETTK